MSPAFVIKRPDGVTRRIDGYRFEEPAPESAVFTGKLEKLPGGVDLRKHLGPVEDHGGASNCVVNAAAAAYECLVKRHLGDEAFGVSRSFVYFNTKAQAGDRANAGIAIADALSALSTFGACSEQVWPYDATKLEVRPSDAAFDQAGALKVEVVERVPTDLRAWKQALAQGFPIVFGLLVYGSLDRHRQPGRVPVPSDKDIEGEQGEHAMLCVGYSDTDGVFIARNSWGPAWGDEGYCYIPYDYLMDAELNRGDAWVLRRTEQLEPDRATWGDRGVIDDVDTALGQLDDKGWSALLDTLGEVALETRLALIFLAAAEADADVSEAGLSAVAGALDTCFQSLGAPFEADRVLREALSLIDESALIDDSIGLIGEHFDEDVLANIVRAAGHAAGLDDLAGAEDGTLADLVDAWLGGAAPREGGLVDGLPGEYGDVDYAGGVYGDDEEPDDLSDGFNEVD